MGTLTFKEAFLLYIEYIAKATQGDLLAPTYLPRFGCDALSVHLPLL